MSEAEQGPYRVSLIDAERQKACLLAWSKEAEQLGMAEQFRADLADIGRLLAEGPTTWGDPLFRPGGRRYLVFHGMRGLLHAYYAVHEEARLVWVQRIGPLPGRGFSDAPTT